MMLLLLELDFFVFHHVLSHRNLVAKVRTSFRSKLLDLNKSCNSNDQASTAKVENVSCE